MKGNLIPFVVPLLQAAYTCGKDPAVGEVIEFSGAMYRDPVAALLSFLSHPYSLGKQAACLSRGTDGGYTPYPDCALVRSTVPKGVVSCWSRGMVTFEAGSKDPVPSTQITTVWKWNDMPY
jgi:hypothetical protein